MSNPNGTDESFHDEIYPPHIASDVSVGVDRNLCLRRLSDDAERLFTPQRDEVSLMRVLADNKGIVNAH
jgi:hypothetical protein